MDIKNQVRVCVHAEMFSLFAGGDVGVGKGDSGGSGDSFDERSAANKDTLCFIFIN